jgi:hypothetical protein
MAAEKMKFLEVPQAKKSIFMNIFQTVCPHKDFTQICSVKEAVGLDKKKLRFNLLKNNLKLNLSF